jgi:hypothetical protein
MTEPTTKVRTAFTKDERGILNNWAIEPKMYFDDQAEQKSDQQVGERFGMTEYAELINGRSAMIGFSLLIMIELATGKGFLQIIGF